MKFKAKKNIARMTLILCITLLLGTSRTAAKFAADADAGAFFLTLEALAVDPGQAYTLVYHTYDEAGEDVVYKTQTIYENLSYTIASAPPAHSDLTFMGWSPQGSWIDEGDDYVFIPDPSDQKDNVNLPSYVEEQRILHTAASKVQGKDLVFLQDGETNTIHLYDLYQEHYVKFDGTQTSVQWISVDFRVYTHTESVLYERLYWGQNILPTTNNTVNYIGYKLYGTIKTHYIHPGFSYYVGVHGTVGNGAADSNGDREFTATTTLYCLFNGATTTVGKETYNVADGNRTFIPKATNADNPSYNPSSTCFATGTLISMADGTQLPVEELKKGDLVRVYDHENGCYTVSPVLFTEYDGDREWRVMNLVFSDGTTQKFIYEHGLFDLDLNQYVYITEENCQSFIGHRFATESDEGYGEVTLTHASIETELTGCYSLTTAYHLNYFVNGMFSMPGGISGLFNFFAYDENLAYDREQMAQDIATYGLFSYEDFADYMSEETFETIFPVKYLKVSVGKGLVTFEELETIIERYIYGHELDG